MSKSDKSLPGEDPRGVCPIAGGATAGKVSLVTFYLPPREGTTRGSQSKIFQMERNIWRTTNGPLDILIPAPLGL